MKRRWRKAIGNQRGDSVADQFRVCREHSPIADVDMVREAELLVN